MTRFNKKFFYGVLIVSAVLSACLSPALADEEPTVAAKKEICTEGGQQQMNICMRAHFEEIDAEMNGIYSKLHGSAKPGLQKSQRAWLKYRDAECLYEEEDNGVDTGGTLQPYINSECMAENKASANPKLALGGVLCRLIVDSDCNVPIMGIIVPNKGNVKY